MDAMDVYDPKYRVVLLRMGARMASALPLKWTAKFWQAFSARARRLRGTSAS